jgi:type I restriction enzyme M protein
MTTPASSTIVQRLWNYCNVLRDESLEDSANLPDPDVLAAEIVDDFQSALEQFEGIVEQLKIEEG